MGTRKTAAKTAPKKKPLKRVFMLVHEEWCEDTVITFYHSLESARDNASNGDKIYEVTHAYTASPRVELTTKKLESL